MIQMPSPSTRVHQDVVDPLAHPTPSQSPHHSEVSTEITRHLNDALLHEILPRHVAASVTGGFRIQPDEFRTAGIFFSDIVGFTGISSAQSAVQVMQLLNVVYSIMDICLDFFPNLYKVETIGDSYMVASGFKRTGELDAEHVSDLCEFALLVSRTVSEFVRNPTTLQQLELRIGINVGPVCAGVVGKIMPRYTVFGDTVNVASRAESTSETNRIQVTEGVHAMLRTYPGRFFIQFRGEVDIKGKGAMPMYWLNSSSMSRDEAFVAGINQHVWTKIVVNSSVSAEARVDLCCSPKSVKTPATLEDKKTTTPPRISTAVSSDCLLSIAGVVVRSVPSSSGSGARVAPASFLPTSRDSPLPPESPTSIAEYLALLAHQVQQVPAPKAVDSSRIPISRSCSALSGMQSSDDHAGDRCKPLERSTTGRGKAMGNRSMFELPLRPAHGKESISLLIASDSCSKRANIKQNVLRNLSYRYDITLAASSQDVHKHLRLSNYSFDVVIIDSDVQDVSDFVSMTRCIL